MKIFKYLFLTAILLALNSCGKKSSSATSQQSLVWATSAEHLTLDPQKLTDIPSVTILCNVYDTLIEMDAKTLELSPRLAKTWKQIDTLTWEFELFEGVKFHNGDLLTVEDVIFTIERGKKLPGLSHSFKEIGRVEKVSERVLRIITPEPFAPLPFHIAGTNMSIVSKKAVTEGGKDYGVKTAIGTGPFKLKEIISGTSVTLIRNEEYFKEPAKLAKIEFRVMADPQARAFALQAGDVDMIMSPTALDREALKKLPQFEVLLGSSLSYTYLGFNHTKKYLKDQKVRMAIAHAVDAQGIINAPEISGGIGKVAGSPLPPSVFGSIPVERYAYNPELAKKILDEAGYPEGEDGIRFPLTLTVSTGKAVTMATYIQGFFKEIGIAVEVKTLEWGAYLEKTGRGESELFLLGWSVGSADAHSGLYHLFHSKLHGKSGNRGFHSNPRIDHLIDSGKAEIDVEKRKEIYAEAQRILVKEVANLPLSYSKNVAVISRKVKGFVMHPGAHHPLYSTYIEE